jgi:hypothetical protein
LIIHRFIAAASVVNNVQIGLEHCSDQCITVNVVHGNGEPRMTNMMLSPRCPREGQRDYGALLLGASDKEKPGPSAGIATAVGWRSVPPSFVGKRVCDGLPLPASRAYCGPQPKINECHIAPSSI